MSRRSPLFRSRFLYALVMRMLYGHRYDDRYRAVAELIPPDSSVVDLCCGPARLYRRHLKKKNVRYIGLDVSDEFISSLRRTGVSADVVDLRNDGPLPEADYLIMQGALYCFLPDAHRIVDRMLRAAKKGVIIEEPVKNVAIDSRGWLARLAAIANDAGSGPQPQRFTAETFDEFFDSYSSHLDQSLSVAGGRARIVVLKPMLNATEPAKNVVGSADF